MNHRWIIVAVSLTILAACGPKRVGLLSEEGVSIRGNNASLVESAAGKVVMKNIDYGTNGFAHYTPDQATTGRFDGENFQVGFTDVCDTPYPETVAGIRKVGYRMYDIRNGK